MRPLEVFSRTYRRSYLVFGGRYKTVGVCCDDENVFSSEKMTFVQSLLIFCLQNSSRACACASVKAGLRAGLRHFSPPAFIRLRIVFREQLTCNCSLILTAFVNGVSLTLRTMALSCSCVVHRCLPHLLFLFDCREPAARNLPHQL